MQIFNRFDVIDNFYKDITFFARELNAKQSNGYWILQEYCLQKTPNSINRIIKYDVINSTLDIIVGDFEVDKLFLSGLLSGQSLLLVPVLDLNYRIVSKFRIWY